MKICHVRKDYAPPAKNNMGAERVAETLCRVMSEMGHDVTLCVDQLPTSDFDITTSTSIPDCDIVHFHGDFPKTYHQPWVGTMHGGGTESAPEWLEQMTANPHIICISKFIANRLKIKTVVHNCIDEDKFIYREEKDDYFLWLGGTDWGESKGLFSCMVLAKKLNLKLKIAGTGKDEQNIQHVRSFCDDKIEYCGAVNGQEKAELLAGAKAVLNVGHIADAFCLVNVEALVSGTPVIARDVGAHPEILNNEVAIFCNTTQDVVKAILNIDKIDNQKCRDHALAHYTKRKIAKEYVKCYEKMLSKGTLL